FRSPLRRTPTSTLVPYTTLFRSLLPANKNIGTTHITNGCYHLHPVEWSIGEAVGMLISYVRRKELTPAEVRKDEKILADFQSFIDRKSTRLNSSHVKTSYAVFCL